MAALDGRRPDETGRRLLLRMTCLAYVRVLIAPCSFLRCRAMEGRDGTAAPKAADTAQDAAPPPPNNTSNNNSVAKPKVSLSLGKKKRKKTGTSTSSNANEHFATSTLALAQESEDANKTIADRAVEVAQNRKEDLVIPCVGGGSAGGRTRPLLAGRAQALKTEDDGEAGASADDDKAASGDPVKSEDEDVAIKPDPDANGDYDAAAAEALIRSATDRAQNRTAGGAVGDTNFDARGDLVIKKEENTNELMAQVMRGTKAGGGSHQNQDDETQEFKRDLARQADDLDVESEAYANVPISEFGAAMLRGMGWTGGDTHG